MLTDTEVFELIASGALGIDPLFDPQRVKYSGVVLRLGTELAEFPSPAPYVGCDSDPDVLGQHSPKPFSLDFGKHVSLLPSSGILATSLEIVAMPVDVKAILIPRASLSRLGLICQSSAIYPGFQGKIVTAIFNMGRSPINMSVGTPIFNTSFFRMNSGDSRQLLNSPSASVSFNYPGTNSAGIEGLKELIATRASSFDSGRHSGEHFSKLIDVARSATGAEKGVALEELAAALVESVNGLKILKRNARLRSEEIDILVHNNINTGFWKYAGTPILVECKNWSTKIGSREISIITEKMRSISPDAKTALLVAPLGVSGQHSTDATLKLREKRQGGVYVLTIANADLDDLGRGVPAAIVIERAYDKLMLI